MDTIADERAVTAASTARPLAGRAALVTSSTNCIGLGILRSPGAVDILVDNAGIQHVAPLTVFLCSPGAASITGTALPVDGGWTAH